MTSLRRVIRDTHVDGVRAEYREFPSDARPPLASSAISYLAAMTAPNSTNWIASTGQPGLVSVVIPTCNRARLLTETLQSLGAQDYRPLEIIVVGDGVEDDTPERVEALKQAWQDDVQLQFVSQAPSGAPVARNRGARLASGEYFLFMDDDDLAGPELLRSRVDQLVSSEADFAYGPWQPFMRDDQGQYHLLPLQGEQPGGSSTPWQGFLRRWALLLQGCVIRRRTVAQVGPWDEELHKSQDLDYKARLAGSHTTAAACDHGIVYYRRHAQSITGQLNAEKLASYTQVLDTIESIATGRPDYAENQQLVAEYFLGHAFWLYGHGEFARGWHELGRAQRHDPQVVARHSRQGSWLAAWGGEIILGPAYYASSQLKKRCGLSKPRYIATQSALPMGPTG